MAAKVSDIILANAAARCVPEEPPRCASVAPSLTFSDLTNDEGDEMPIPESAPRRRRASTRLVAQSAADIQRITGESTTELINRCCGGGCCLNGSARRDSLEYEDINLPDNKAFRGLDLEIQSIPTTLSGIAELPEQTAFIEPLRRPSSIPSPTESQNSLHGAASASLEESMSKTSLETTDTLIQPPSFVQPHPPYHVYPAKIHNARELTKPGAEKRTYHFDLDVTSYPGESGVDFRVGGAIGVSAPNEVSMVDEVLDLLLVPRFLRDKPALLRTTKGRWPTVWGDDKPRELVATRRDLLTWCSDIQSYPPNKPLLRVLAEHATDGNERKILMFLCSAEGQGTFCDLRTGPHISLVQLLQAFPSSKPPMDLLLSTLQPLMPRFYSLSNDPHESYSVRDGTQHRLVEIAVSVHESNDWRSGARTGIGSGFFERQAKSFLQAKARGEKPEIYVPMFKGLMANPLAKQFQSDGPMLLIGAGVGIAPFRGFVQRRLKTANCANKVWVLQGIRDSLVDEIYSGEWGIAEEEVKKVVESRRGQGRYVQEEVRHQADLVWYIINAVDGRVFVCGSSKGMGEGVEEALIEVAMEKGNIEREEAKNFWDLRKETGQYIAETW
ncbi:putative methionine synthase reductase [Zalerion maritima]|uniref:Methionine synthase reductase n=1 Tax=Zalerion maritima TaxID=339359 RepID=A0AAD5RUM7_9PEZI|nr:putative methionine synthase reductase [Zalerion maritima]